MRWLVIGGHHGLGAAIVERAHQRGHGMDVFDGDILEPDLVAAAVAGHEVILSTLGPRKTSPADLCSRGTSHLVAAMRQAKVGRLVQVTGALIGHPRDRLGLLYRLIQSSLPKPMLADRRAQERLIQDGVPAWTLIRPTRLTNGPARGRWRDDPTAKVGALSHISRADAAAAVVDAAERDETIGRALTLQY